jgi:hypothetical protein
MFSQLRTSKSSSFTVNKAKRKLISIMPPRADENKLDDAELQPLAKSYEEILANAGKVHLEPAQNWGKGIMQDFKRTVGTHWVEASTGKKSFDNRLTPIIITIIPSTRRQ